MAGCVSGSTWRRSTCFAILVQGSHRSTCKPRIVTCALLSESLRRGVAFMPGEPFFPDAPQRCASLRLSFSHANEEPTQRGLTMLAKLLRYTLETQSEPTSRASAA